MKACTEKSQSNLWMEYNFMVHVKGTYAFIACDNLEQVHHAWKYLRKKYPGKNMTVHRFLTVADVDTQIKRDSIARLTVLLKSIKR